MLRLFRYLPIVILAIFIPYAFHLDAKHNSAEHQKRKHERREKREVRQESKSERREAKRQKALSEQAPETQKRPKIRAHEEKSDARPHRRKNDPECNLVGEPKQLGEIPSSCDSKSFRSQFNDILPENASCEIQVGDFPGEFPVDAKEHMKNLHFKEESLPEQPISFESVATPAPERVEKPVDSIVQEILPEVEKSLWDRLFGK